MLMHRSPAPSLIPAPPTSRVSTELKKIQLRFELAAATDDAFHRLVVVQGRTQPNGTESASWSAGSTSVVRLQGLVRERCPALYEAVIEGEDFCGTFQAFLCDVVQLHLFFYDDVDCMAYPVLRLLHSRHEQRCAVCAKDVAVPWDTAVAEYWASRFVPVELPTLAWDIVAASAAAWTSDPFAESAAAGEAVQPVPQCSARDDMAVERGTRGRMRQLVHAIVSQSEALHPFSMLISKNRLKDAAYAALRQTLFLMSTTVQQVPPRAPEAAAPQRQLGAAGPDEDSLHRLVTQLLLDNDPC
jgi:hypothetical protein